MQRIVSKVAKLHISRSSRVFLLIFCCLAFVTVMGAGVLGRQTIANQRNAYAVKLARETERVHSHFAQAFEANTLSCNAVFSAKWYKHYRNVAGIYTHEFDGMKRIEISESLQSMVTGLPYVSDVLIITPALDSVICRNGWYTLKNYQTIYATVRIDDQGDTTRPPAITVVGDNLAAVTLNDASLRRDKTVLCMLVDTKAFAAQLQRVYPESAAYLHAALEGQVLGEWGVRSESLVFHGRSSIHPLFTLSIGYPPFEQAELPGILALLLLLQVTLLLVSAFIALLATRIITQPMNRMVLDAGGQKHDLANPFRFLQEYLNKLSLRQDQLSAEKVSLLRSKERFLALMHDEIYFGMLTNPNFHLEDEYVCSVIPEIRDQKPCLLALITPKYPYHSLTQQPRHGIFEPFADRVASIEVNEEQYFFLWTGAQEIDARERAVAEVLERLHMDHTALARADHPSGIHAAYRQLKRALDKQRGDWLVLPVSVENSIVNLLRTNAAEKCRQLLLSLRGQHTSDALMRLMGRVATEYGHSLEALLDQYYGAVEARDEQAQWDTLEACVAELCAFAAGSRRRTASGPSAEDVCEYVREHYKDPDLCAALLADRFTLHRTLISKLIKTHTGLTFSDWLQQLRMEAAMRLLRETDLPASAIAEQVGYTNYNTFKRAFIRHYGQTPREHREGTAKA